jgi:hypothetical protein
MEPVKFGFADVTREASALLGEHWLFVGAITLAIAGGYAALDLAGLTQAQSIVNIVVTIFVQYMFAERLLADRLATGFRQRRYGALFIAGFLGGLGVIVGFVLLIVPGIVLLSGWAASTAFVVVEGRSGTESLGESWRATAGSRLPLALVYLVYCAVLGLALVALVLGLERFGEDGVIEVAASNALIGVLTVGGWLLGIAIYRVAVPERQALEGIFA